MCVPNNRVLKYVKQNGQNSKEKEKDPLFDWRL